MVGIFTYIYHKKQPFMSLHVVGKFTIHGSYGYDYDHEISPSGTQVMWIPPSLRGIIQHPLLFSTWLIIVQDSTPGSENWKPFDLLIVSPMFVEKCQRCSVIYVCKYIP